MSTKFMHYYDRCGRHNNNFDDKTIQLDGETIFYSIEPKSGKDETIIFIHGAFVDCNTMRPLARQFEKHQCVLVDLPGHGNSTGDPKVSMEEYARTVKEFIQKLIERNEIHNRIILVGWSMGGSISLDVDLLVFHRIKAIILLSSSPMWQFPQIPREAFNLEQLFASAFTDRTPEESKEVILSQISEYASPLDTCMMDITVLNSFDIRTRLNEIDVPTLIISGDADTVALPEMQHVMHDKIKHSQIKLFEGRGHVLLLESPDDVADVMKSFIHKHLD